MVIVETERVNKTEVSDVLMATVKSSTFSTLSSARIVTFLQILRETRLSGGNTISENIVK